MASDPGADDFDVITADEIAESQQGIETDTELVEKLRLRLQPTDYLSPGNEYMKHLHSYVPGTGNWLRNTHLFREWQNSDGRRCIYLRGVAGSGKSVFAASVIRQLLDAKKPVVFFFFRQIVNTNHQPKWLVRDWLSQLLPHSPWLQFKLHNLGTSFDGAELDALWNLLRTGLNALPEVYCIADALDEMDESPLFMEQLKELGNASTGNIKLMLTSRPIPKIEQVFRHSAITSLKLEPASIYPDIIEYVDARLASLPDKLGNEKHMLVREAICDRAQGLFLHARLMTDSLFEGLSNGSLTEETLPTSLAKLPRNLTELYTTMLEEHALRSGVSKSQQLTILSCVINTSRPLRLNELGSLIAQTHTVSDLKEGKALVRASCGSLLEILEDETVSVLHHSFTEFLRGDGRQADERHFPILDAPTAHRTIVLTCLQYLARCGSPAYEANRNTFPKVQTEEGNTNDDEEPRYYDNYDDSTSDEVADAEEAKRQTLKELKLANPLLDYASSSLSHHISNASSKDDTMWQMLDTLWIPTQPVFEIWVLHHWQSCRRWKVLPLQAAVVAHLDDYVEHLIKSGTPVDVEDAAQRTAASYAAELGRDRALQCLITNGCSLESSDRDGLKPLHFAAKQGHATTVELLLNTKSTHAMTKKTKISRCLLVDYGGDDRGETPLQHACEQGHVGVISKLIATDMDGDEMTRCLHWTIRSGKTAAVEAVLGQGVPNVDALVDGTTALCWATSKFDHAIVKVLLRHGANPNTVCTSKKSDSSRYLYGVSHSSVVEQHNGGAPGPTAMHAFGGYFDDGIVLFGRTDAADTCLRLLLEAGADINSRSEDGETALHLACKKRSHSLFGDEWCELKTEEILSQLLLAHGADPNTQDDRGHSPIFGVHPVGRNSLIDLLANHGADMNVTCHGGATLLTHMLRHHRQDWGVGSESGGQRGDTLASLIQHGANLHHKDADGRTVVHHAIQFLKQSAAPSFIRLLLDAKLDINQKDKHGRPPITLWPVEYPDDAGILPLLVSNGLDVNSVDAEGQNVLMHALRTYGCKVDTIQYLVKNGCSVAARDSRGANLLHYAIQYAAKIDIGEYLVEAGVDPLCCENEGNLILHWLFRRSGTIPEAFLTFCLQHGIDINLPNSLGQTALHLGSFYDDNALHFGSSYGGQLQEALLAHNPALDARDRIGATALHYAVSRSEKATFALLRAGADPTVLTHKGFSLLHIAARAGQSNTLGLVLNAYSLRGIISNMIDLVDNTNHMTALHYACCSGAPESVRLLIQYGASVASVRKSKETPLHCLARASHAISPLHTAQANTGLLTPETSSKFQDQIDQPMRTQQYSLALTYARVGGRVAEIVYMLKDQGVDFEAKAHETSFDKGLTATDLAVGCHFTEMVHVLRRLGYRASDRLKEAVIPPERDASDASAIYSQLWEATQSKSQVSGGRGNDLITANGRKFVDSDILSPVLRMLLKRGDHHVAAALCKMTLPQSLAVLVEDGHVHLLEDLIDNLAEEDEAALQRDPNWMPLLTAACRRQTPNLEVVKLLVEKARVKINVAGDLKWHQLPLHSLANSNPSFGLAALNYLLDKGADLERRDQSGRTPLLYALESDGAFSERMVKEFLRLEADPNVTDAQGLSCLQKSRSPALTQLLIEAGAKIDTSAILALVAAVENKNVSMVKKLLQAGIDPNLLPSTRDAASRYRREDGKPRFVLHRAALPTLYPSDNDDKSTTILELVAILLQHHANPYATYRDASFILQHIIENHGPVEPFLSLPKLDLEFRGSGDRTLLISACYPCVKREPPRYQRRRYHIVQPSPKPFVRPSVGLELLGQGADAAALDDRGRSALHWLCTHTAPVETAHQTLFMTLLDRAPKTTSLPDKDGLTPFHLAIRSCQARFVDHFITLGADITQPDPSGNTALHYIADHLCGVREQAIAAASQFRHYLAQGIPIDHRNAAGETALFRFITQSWHGSCPVGESFPSWAIENDIAHLSNMSIFENAGADFYTRNNHGETLLHATAKRWATHASYLPGDQTQDMVHTFRYLLKKGLDPMLEDAQMRSAIDVAVAAEHGFLVDLFREGRPVVHGGKRDGDDDDEGDGDGDGDGGDEQFGTVRSRVGSWPNTRS